MSNVLPEQAAKVVWRMYRARFIIAGSLVAIAAAALGILALLPSYLALHVDQTAVTVASSTPSSDQSDRDAIVRVQALLSVLLPYTSATTTSTDGLARAHAARPRGVIVNHVSYTAGKSGVLVLTGLASGREGVNAYRTALSADPFFKGVSVPIRDLTGSDDGKFSVTLSGNF